MSPDKPLLAEACETLNPTLRVHASIWVVLQIGVPFRALFNKGADYFEDLKRDPSLENHSYEYTLALKYLRRDYAKDILYDWGGGYMSYPTPCFSIPTFLYSRS